MNTGRLRELLDLVLDADDELEVGEHFEKFQQALNNLQSSPSDANIQKSVAVASNELRAVLNKLQRHFSPTDLVQLDDLGGVPYVTTAAFERISAVQLQSELTPAVVA